ncbi:MAG TPA: prepilin-type N-terminal cleavage/methylation domain-containing protein [Candidatus Binatia bacterium]|nr:prepilin-type N-terminal cleavage/methylation domain-containing protein [Candidatus Binatia bacterium]
MANSFRRHERPALVCRGFTLIELMVVIVLIGILTAMIIPEMKGTYQDALLRSTGRELLNVCNIAYSRAVSLNQLQRVRFDTRTGRYLIESRLRETGRDDDFIPLRDVAGSEGELDARILVSFRPAAEESLEPASQEPVEAPAEEAKPGLREALVSFYPDGTADSGEFLLQDQDGFRLVLRINPVTARVRVIELARE